METVELGGGGEGRGAIDHLHKGVRFVKNNYGQAIIKQAISEFPKPTNSKWGPLENLSFEY